MKTVVFCRHGKSDWPDGVTDLNRPLKDRGIADAEYLGNLLADREFRPDLIISSPANRALSTAKLIAGRVGYDQESIRIEPTIYYEAVGSMIAHIEQLSDNVDTVMIFGHNPTMENMVRYLLKSESRYEMPTLGMACFETYMSWKNFAYNCQLRWLLVPRLQRKS